MTTLSKIKLITFAEQSGLQVEGRAEFAYTVRIEHFAALARADLEATIAEKDAEIERLRNNFMAEVKSIEVGANKIIESKFSELRQQCTEQQAYIERILSFTKDVAKEWDCDSDAHKYGTPCRACEAEKLLRDISTSTEALRQHDAELVEMIADDIEAKVGFGDYMRDLADQIRKGTLNV